MRKMAAVGTIVLILFTAGLASAKSIDTLSQNVFTTAESLDTGMTQLGFAFTAGDGYESFYPMVRYGAGALFEIGGRFGFSSADVGPENKVSELIGADVKYQMIKQTEDIPVDMAVDLGFDMSFINSKNISELTLTALFSRSFPLTEQGYKLTPYGGMQFASDFGSYLSNQNTDFYVLGGLEWKVTQKTLVYVELKTGSHTLGGFGLRFEY